MPILRRDSNCSERSLSRARTIATDSLTLYTPIISNCRTTAVPYWVTDAPILGITASTSSRVSSSSAKCTLGRSEVMSMKQRR